MNIGNCTVREKQRKLHAPDDDGSVRSPEPEGIGNGYIDLHLTSFIGAIIKIARLVLIENIDGRRGNLMIDSQRRKDGLDASRGT